MSNLLQLLIVSGVNLPQPTKYNVFQSDTDSAETDTNEAGVLMRDVLRSNQYKIEVSWMLKGDDLKLITDAIGSPGDPKEKMFMCEFVNPYEQKRITRKMYAGARQAILKANAPGYSGQWWELTCNFIEK